MSYAEYLNRPLARVEHLVQEDEEPLAGDVTIVERVLALKPDYEPLAEVLRPETHDRREAVLEDPLTAHAHVALGAGDQAHRRLASGVDNIPVVALVLRRVRIDCRRQPRVVPRGRARVVVPKVDAPRRRHAHFPNPMAAKLVQRGLRAQSSPSPCQGSFHVVVRVQWSTNKDGYWALLPFEGQAIGVGAVCVDCVRRRWSVSGGNRCQQIGGWEHPGSAACIVIDVVWAPARVVSEFPPGWENPLPAARAAQQVSGPGESWGWQPAVP